MICKSRAAFTFLFLAYFFFYAVSPLSAALPRDGSPDGSEPQGGLLREAVSFLVEASRACEMLCGEIPDSGADIDPFIFDMALWKILKEGNTSDETDGPVLRKAEAGDFPGTDGPAVLGSTDVRPPDFAGRGSRISPGPLSLPSDTPLFCSGLSPPSA